MNKQIDKGIIAIVISIIILILACLGYIIFEKNKEIQNKNKTTTTNITTTTKNIGKIDNNKEYVHDAIYKNVVEKESYTINDKTYNIKDYKAPFINLNSDYANKVNNDIKKLYDEAINIYNEGASNESNILDIFEYEYYKKNDILSLVIIYRYGGIDAIYNNYKTYNINLNTGENVSLDDIINFKNLKKEEVIQNIKEKIIDEYEKTFENTPKDSDFYKQNYESLKQETLDKFDNGKNIKYFIDNSNYINVIATICIPAGSGQIDVIIKSDK